MARIRWLVLAIAYEVSIRLPDWPGCRAAHNWAAGIALNLDCDRHRMW